MLKFSSFKIFFIIFSILISPIVSGNTVNITDFHGTWQGIEVIGGNEILANQIRQIIPLKIGSPICLTEEPLKEWCQKVNVQISPLSAKCNLVGYPGQKHYYYIVDVINITDLNPYRKIEKNKLNNLCIPKKLYSVFKELNTKRFKALVSGVPSGENFKKGYVDYSDPKLKKLTHFLGKNVPKHNTLLIDVITYSLNIEHRKDASTMLSWAKLSENQIEQIIDKNLLMDPDGAVRNNLTRSLSFYFNNIFDNHLTKKIIHSCCQQMNLPSHGDRNKALISIDQVLMANPQATQLVPPECQKDLKYISKMSILPNVGLIATELLNKIETP
jgi:hypothetical protein